MLKPKPNRNIRDTELVLLVGKVILSNKNTRGQITIQLTFTGEEIHKGVLGDYTEDTTKIGYYEQRCSKMSSPWYESLK